MSTRRGDTSRSRPQKHQNKTAFKNNLHDTSHTTKFINSLHISQVCKHCKDVIEWKIKYKKYKPLTQPKTCTKCSQKTIKQAYHIMCIPCSQKLKVCPKCSKAEELVPKVATAEEQQRMDAEMRQTLKTLSERKRRTFLRYMNSNKKNKDDAEDATGEKPNKEELIAKLDALKVDDGEDDSLDFGDSDGGDDGGDFSDLGSDFD
ncbi:uncharacterized protein C9orf85 homolog [Ctenocephalides felis]|uniref:uncharacterized protein C9orf85 homolog n=1 Tax=Ctenocephalides felis TaxID=7515 RepID=UPI000E6E2343|nr:uncharacterized protein C9orf85 homolog [Ctenocephalides felis]